MKKHLHSNLQKTAEQLSHWLTAKGYDVRTSRVCHTPLLAVTGPLPKEMQARAVLSRECLAGVVREVAWCALAGACCTGAKNPETGKGDEMSKIQLDIEDEALARVVLRQLPKFLEFCSATHQEELASATAEQYSAVMCPPVPGSNKIH